MIVESNQNIIEIKKEILGHEKDLGRIEKEMFSNQ